MKNQRLWYDEPAKSWIFEEGLPLGNGSFGAMVYGGVDEILFQLNQDTVWYGGKRERVNPSALEALPKVRKLLFEGRLAEAEQLAYMGLYGMPMSQGHYEPLANFKMVMDTRIPHHSAYGKERTEGYTDYNRSLVLTMGVHQQQYVLNKSTYTCESFISYPAGLMAIKVQVDGDATLDMRFELERGDHYEQVKTVGFNRILLEGLSGGGGSQFVAMVHIEPCGGTLEQVGPYITLKNTKQAILFVSGQTDFEGCAPLVWCENALDEGALLGYDQLYEDHLKDYQALYEQVRLEISQDEDFETLTTKVRLERVKNGQPDEGLLNLYFNYGRYLLISCSRPGSLPANLQGLWNRDMTPPWGSKYTININTQMNYWPAEVTGLSECHQPLLDHLQRMLKRGQEVAKSMYGCRGFVAHHNTDIYGDCAPQDQWMPATVWPMGAAWLLTHWLEHYAFCKDLEVLKEGYMLLHEASLFFVDYLIEDNEGQLVTSPSTSPENTYLLENGEKSALCFGPSMDSQIIHQLWSGFLEASSLLGKDNDVVQSVLKMIPRLPKTRLGSRGQILEWTKEYDEWEPGHRHISHLYALHPGHAITQSKTPELFEGAKVTLNERLAKGGGHTGWSRAWIINMWARLLEGEAAYAHIYKLMTQSTADNLFDMHPPFQIDGNFGGTAGMCEMLMQSHEGFIRLLPALPKAWATGSVKGLRARGAIKVDLAWEHSVLSYASFFALKDTSVVAHYKDIHFSAHLKAGETVTFDPIERGNLC